MGRVAKNKIEKEERQKIKCVGKCERELGENNFYNSNSPLFPNGKANLCKKCIQDMIDSENIQTIYDVLQMLDLPFLYQYWVSAKNKNPNNPWGAYIRMCNSGLNEFKGKRYKDSSFDGDGNNQRCNANTFSFDDIERDLLNEFRPTKDMLLRWGTKYVAEQYIRLENFYNDMKEKNNIETPQEEDYLKKLAVISMKMDEELENGNYSQAKSLGDLFSKYMADSKFRTTDKTDADKTGGIRSFSVIYAEVESDDFIPPWSYYAKIKNIGQDIVDKCIMHIENFTLRLNRAERMNEPPSDTPELIQEETTLDLVGDING